MGTIVDVAKKGANGWYIYKPKVIFVLGGPGSGKGTQCENIEEHFDYTHLSADDLHREERDSGSENGTMIKNMMEKGEIVPFEVTIKLLQEAMLQDGNDIFLIDGFPRNEENRAAFESVAGIEPEFVLFFDCPEEEMEKRVLNRNQNRDDDNIETIRNRIKVYMESTLPVIQYYNSKGKVREIDAAKPIDQVFEAVKEVITSYKDEEANGSPHICKIKVVFVLGGPGSGKGTQCANIEELFEYTHLSAGDLLRAERDSGSENGTMIKNMMEKGEIVPSEVTIKLLQRAMEEDGNDVFLIDGFPRNEENRAAFESITGIEPEFVLFLDCPEEEMEKRILNRNQNRDDDNIETIRNRFKVYMESTLPVIEYYNSKGKVHKIDAAKPIDQVYEAVTEVFTSYEDKFAE